MKLRFIILTFFFSLIVVDVNAQAGSLTLMGPAVRIRFANFLRQRALQRGTTPQRFFSTLRTNPELFRSLQRRFVTQPFRQFSRQAPAAASQLMGQPIEFDQKRFFPTAVHIPNFGKLLGGFLQFLDKKPSQEKAKKEYKRVILISHPDRYRQTEFYDRANEVVSIINSAYDDYDHSVYKGAKFYKKGGNAEEEWKSSKSDYFREKFQHLFKMPLILATIIVGLFVVKKNWSAFDESSHEKAFLEAIDYIQDQTHSSEGRKKALAYLTRYIIENGRKVPHPSIKELYLDHEIHTQSDIKKEALELLSLLNSIVFFSLDEIDMIKKPISYWNRYRYKIGPVF